MKRNRLLLFFGLMVWSSIGLHSLQAQVERDKQLHFVGGALYGLGGAGLGSQLSQGDPFWTFAGAMGASAVIGVAKEWADDTQNPGSWSNGDLLATLAGGAFTGLITYLIFKPKNRAEVAHGLGGTPVLKEKVVLKSFKRPPGLALLAAPAEIQQELTTSLSP